jgi:protein-S-isoprenylcysteine O-methyltransferase Ste14
MKEKNGEHPYGDAVQLLLLVVFLIVWIYDSFFWHKSTFLANYIPVYIRLILSAVVVVTGYYLFRSCHFITHKESRPKGVVETGIFAYVRHPLYLGAILFYLGLVMFTISLFSLFLFVVIFFFYNYIADYEEKLLEAKFGEAYAEYKNRTGKWVPRYTRVN